MQEQHDDCEVLQEQDADAQPPVGSRQLVALGEPLEDDCRAGERDEQADEDGERHRCPRRRRRERDDQGGARHLQQPGGKDRPPDLPHRRQRKIEANGEEQQDDAELGEHLDVFRVADHAGPGGSGHHAGEHQRDDRGDAQPREQHDQREANRVGDEEVREESVVGHAMRS